MNASIFKTWIVATALIALIGLEPNSAKAGLIVPGTEQAHLDFANDPMFQSVGALRGVDDTGAFVAGSGVLIHPEWVLTAAHVLDNGWNSVQFLLDQDFRSPTRTLYSADAWYLYPGFVDDGGAGTANDIALVHLSVPIVGVVPADIYWGDIPVGTQAYWSGYGRLGYYPSGEATSSGIKRGGENTVDEIGSVFLGVQDQFFLADFGPAYFTPTLPLEMNGTSGDSGGGWFADMGDGYQLIGLTEFTRIGFDLTGALRPAAYQPWITSYVPLTTVPEPSSALLMLAVLPFAVRRRLQRRRNC